jgi:Holliday junction resolvasome RuvABC endonuclease subunit
MNYVGIDPSLANTAVCVLGPTGRVAGGYNFKRSKAFHLPKKTPGYTWLRLGQLRQFVTESILLTDGNSQGVVVGYEDYSLESTNKPFTIGELGGVLKLVLTEQGWIPNMVEPTVLKKFATGAGHAGKQEMIDQAKLESEWIRSLKKPDLTDDLCDAYFLAKWVWYLSAPSDVVKHEIHRDKLRERLEYVALTKKRKEK